MQVLLQQVARVARNIGVAVPVPLALSRPKIAGTPDLNYHFAENFWFNALVVSCILLDSIVVGVEIDYSYGDKVEDRMVYWLADLAIGLVFVVEMVIRLHQQGWEYFSDTWNVFDYICVSTGVTSLVQPTSDGATSDAANLRVIKALKGFRVLRLLRVVRHIGGLRIVEGLWLLVSSLLSSVRTLFWVGVFMAIVVYCFGVALVTLAGTDKKLYVYWEHADVYVGGVGKSMWTVIQVATLDNWASDIARPLFQVVPEGGALLLVAIVVISFGIVNVIIAVMLENIRATMEKKNERTQKKLEETELLLQERMLQDFYKCDLDRSGELELEEFQKLLKDKKFTHKLRLLGVQLAEAEQLFSIIDGDGSGSVSPTEFINGLWKIRGPASGQDLVKIICFAQKQCARARKYVDRVRRLSERADVMQRRLNSMGATMTAEISDRKEAKVRKQEVLDAAAQCEAIVRRMHYGEQVTFPALKVHPPK